MKGFTLVEALISVLISSVAMIFMASVWVGTMQMNRSFELQAESEKDKWSAESMIRAAFLQAVDLTYAVDSLQPGNVLNSFKGQGGPNVFSGVIREFDSDRYWADTNPATYTLAIFNRDESRSVNLPVDLPAVQSEYHTTGLYFQKPTVKTWGVLYLDLGQKRNAVPPDLRVSALEGIKLEGLTRLRILNVRTYNPTGTTSVPAFSLAPPDVQPVTSFDLEMTFRKYIASQTTEESLIFCPGAFMTPLTPPCTTKTTYRDSIRTLRIVVRNNVLSFSPTAIIPSPLPPGSPSRYGGRVYDRIHFFKPKIEKGLL